MVALADNFHPVHSTAENFFAPELMALRISKDKPTMEETELEGTLGNVSIQERWPLWFVQFLGWHCITFDYLAMVGSGKQ